MTLINKIQEFLDVDRLKIEEHRNKSNNQQSNDYIYFLEARIRAFEDVSKAISERANAREKIQALMIKEYKELADISWEVINSDLKEPITHEFKEELCCMFGYIEALNEVLNITEI